MTMLALAMAAAALVPVPLMSDEEVAGMIDTGSALEIRLDGDLNGDGEIDTIYVERGEDVRKLTVMLAYRGEVDLGHQPVGVLAMDPYPVQGGPASLSIEKGVLIVEDLTGGTTATSSLYRFRYDPKAERMRLIGLDAKFYSRTNAHGWSSVSWNLLNGAFVEESAELLDSGDYADPASKRSKRPSKTLYMEDAPSAEALVMGE